MICRKCNVSATIVIRKEYWYCENCFLTNTNHKFRACLGKSKILSPNERVLICLSGDANSTVLLNLVHNGITLKGTKTLRIVPYFLHVVETSTEDCLEKANLIIEQCKKQHFDLYVININDYYSTRNILPKPNTIPTTNSDTIGQMKSNISVTIAQDLMTKIKRQLFLRIANELLCKIVFTAETTTQLAKNMLSNLAIGRGSQVDNDIGLADKRDDTIKILRPMRDVTNEEVDYYVKIKQLKPVYINKVKFSLQSVIDNFVMDLEQNYPSTISTVCKTADKIGSLEKSTNKKNCKLCQSKIVSRSAKLSAVEATIFSRQMCFGHTSNKIESIQHNEEDKNSMFPYIYETLCYSCSRNYSELDNCTLSGNFISDYNNKDNS